MRRLWTITALIIAMMGAAKAHAIVPAISSPYYSNQELTNLKSKAEKGDATAQLTLGQAYMNGQRVVMNEAEGLHWLNLAATQNDGAAEEELGSIYLLGKDVTSNKTVALDWFRRAVAHGQLSARSWVSELTRDHDTYVKLQTAAQTGDAAAQYAFAAFMSPEYPDYGGHSWGEDDAIKWYRLSADQGYAPAEAWIGFYYLMGAIRDKSGPTAPHAIWEADDKTGLFFLGNANNAVYWYEKAAAQGNDEAIHVLPVVYALSREYDTALIEKAMRASALRTLPSSSTSNLAGRPENDISTNAVRETIFEDLAKLCAWYDGQPVEWRNNHLTDQVQIIRNHPQPDKALDCYRHQGDIGLPSGAYIVAYRTEHRDRPDLAQAESDYHKVWEMTSGNGGLVARAAAHMGLIARDRNDLKSAYAWLTVALQGDITVLDSNDATVPEEPSLFIQALRALKELKLTPAQKAEGDRQVTHLSSTHPLPTPPLSPPPPIAVY